MKSQRFASAALRFAIVAVAVWGGRLLVIDAQSQTAGSNASPYTVPRTPWGEPDLEGIWTPEPTGTPVERPKQFGNREFLTEQEAAARAREGFQAPQTNDDDAGPAAAPAVAPAAGGGRGRGGRGRGTAAERLANHRPRNAVEGLRARTKDEAALAGQEYNAWWGVGPDRTRPLNPQWMRTSLIIDPPDGQMPAFTMAALNRLDAREDARKDRSEADGPEDRNTFERCLLHIMPSTGASNTLDATRQIIQTPGYVTMAHDGLTYTRVIPTDGRPPLDGRIRNWLGEGRGHWEGDTLVVEVTNINDKQDGGSITASHNDWVPGIHQHQYFGSGATAKITDRYKRVSPTRIEWTQTISDPAVYTKPWTTIRPLELANDFLMLENACHEGNYGMVALLGGARKNPQPAIDAANAEYKTRKEQLVEMKKKAAAAQGK